VTISLQYINVHNHFSIIQLVSFFSSDKSDSNNNTQLPVNNSMGLEMLSSNGYFLSHSCTIMMPTLHTSPEESYGSPIDEHENRYINFYAYIVHISWIVIKVSCEET
jgi:hypothetical protein